MSTLMLSIIDFFGSSTTETVLCTPKFDLTGVRTHDLQLIDSTFHIPETLTLTTHHVIGDHLQDNKVKTDSSFNP